jgi:hypothetical protein
MEKDGPAPNKAVRLFPDVPIKSNEIQNLNEQYYIITLLMNHRVDKHYHYQPRHTGDTDFDGSLVVVLNRPLQRQ